MRKEREGGPPPDKSLPRLEEFGSEGLQHLGVADCPESPVMESLGEFWVGYDGVPKSTLFGWKSLRLARPLEPGFVLTIEPGIYFIPSLIDLWKSEKRFADFIDYDEVEKWREAGGFRNEEDYLITSDGHRRLGEPGMKPIDIDSVEAFRKAVLA